MFDFISVLIFVHFSSQQMQYFPLVFNPRLYCMTILPWVVYIAWAFCQELYLLTLFSLFAFWGQSSFSGLSKHSVWFWFLSDEKRSTVYLCEGALIQQSENKKRDEKLICLIWQLSKTHLYSGKWSAAISRIIYDVVYKTLSLPWRWWYSPFTSLRGKWTWPKPPCLIQKSIWSGAAALCFGHHYEMIAKAVFEYTNHKYKINLKPEHDTDLYLDASHRPIHLICTLLLMQDFARQKRFLSLV